ncbi:MAG: CoA transferase [Dehalococcoidia bacterium]|nr:CoA transferase [Dehalococcoidia bacterium]
MPSSALDGVTVIDLTQGIAGPYCTRLLADYGADVVKIEPPCGDAARGMGPFLHDDPHPERSGLFLHLNTNKRGATLDLRTATGRRILREMARQVDVLVHDLAPAETAALGIEYATLRQDNPRLVLTSISPFGQTGPYRDWQTAEIVVYAMGGPMFATGVPDREPVKLGGNVGQHHAGACAAAATAIALWTADTQGHGDHLDVSMMRVQAASQDRRTTMFIGYQYTNETNQRRWAGSAPGGGVRPCADGYVNINGSAARFPMLARMIGQEELLHDPRFNSEMARSRPGVSEEFDAYYIPYLMGFTKREAFAVSQEHRIPSGPVYDMADVLADPHFQERGVWQRTRHPQMGEVTQTGRPFLMGETPWALRRTAPALGEHNAQVYCGMLGYAPLELAQLRIAGVI